MEINKYLFLNKNCWEVYIDTTALYAISKCCTGHARVTAINCQTTVHCSDGTCNLRITSWEIDAMVSITTVKIVIIPYMNSIKQFFVIKD